MSFGKELREKSIKTDYSDVAKKIWKSMKQPLLDFATEKNEPGCTIVFQNVSDGIIQELIKIAESEEITLYYWYPDSPGHPGVKNQDLGLITWDLGLFLAMYPFKVSPNIVLVTLNDSNEVQVEFATVKP